MARVALWGGSLFEVTGGDLRRFLEDRWFWIQKPSGLVQANYLRRTYMIAVNRWFFAARLALNMPCQAMEAGGANRCQG